MCTVEIGGKRYLWRDLLKLRREQKKVLRHAQLTLFERKEDRRPETQRSAEGRYSQPLLFKTQLSVRA
jgi:hypothetical protein